MSAFRMARKISTAETGANRPSLGGECKDRKPPTADLAPHKLLTVVIYNVLQRSIGGRSACHNKRRNAASPLFSRLT